MSNTSRPTRDRQLARAFGARLQGLRSERELSQLALANRSGVATTFVSALEQGRRQPSLMTIKKLAAGLDITMGDLLEGLDDDAPNGWAVSQIALVVRSMPKAQAEAAVRLVKALPERR